MTRLAAYLNVVFCLAVPLGMDPQGAAIFASALPLLAIAFGAGP